MDQMTIYYLHPCARISADWLHDKLLPIMASESMQLIATAIQLRFLESDDRLPIARFQNHPWLSWAMQSADHIDWLYSYYQCCTKKMEEVFKREDRSWKFQIAVRDWITVFPRESFTSPPCVVPEDCRLDDIFLSYRKYYIKAKCKPALYKRVRMPYWVRDHYNAPDEPDEIPVDPDENPGIIEI